MISMCIVVNVVDTFIQFTRMMSLRMVQNCVISVRVKEQLKKDVVEENSSNSMMYRRPV
jgi:hypothetical protein